MSAVAHTLIILMLLLISTGALVAWFTQSRAGERELGRRMSLIALLPGRGVTVEAPQKASAMAALDKRALDIFAFALKHRWGMEAGAIKLMLFAFVGSMAAWLLLRTFLHFSVWIAGSAAIFAFLLVPRQLLKLQQSRAEQAFMDLFPASLDMIVRMVRAGLTITGAIRAVGTEASPPVNKVFTSLADQVDIGMILTDALASTGERIGMSDFRFFAVAVSLQHSTGGNIAATLEVLSDIIRKRRLIRLKAKATTGEVRVSAYVLASLPFVVIGGLLIISPAYLAPLVNDPRGNIIVGSAIMLLLTGFSVMRQMMRSATRF